MLQIGYIYVPPRPGGLVCQWRPDRPRSSRTQIQPGGLRDRKTRHVRTTSLPLARRAGTARSSLRLSSCSLATTPSGLRLGLAMRWTMCTYQLSEASRELGIARAGHLCAVNRRFSRNGKKSRYFEISSPCRSSVTTPSCPSPLYQSIRWYHMQKTARTNTFLSRHTTPYIHSKQNSRRTQCIRLY